MVPGACANGSTSRSNSRPRIDRRLGALVAHFTTDERFTPRDQAAANGIPMPLVGACAGVILLAGGTLVLLLSRRRRSGLPR